MGGKTSIVLQLQEEALDSSIPVSELLRKAKVVATKLNLKDFLAWIENELNGYMKIKPDEIPLYRFVNGHVKGLNPYRGWQPVFFEDQETEELVSRKAVGSRIIELEELAKANEKAGIFICYDAKAKKSLLDAVDYCTDIALKVEKSSIIGILDAVRNHILNWSLGLEKEGILGEDLSFTREEQQKAATSTINIQVGAQAKFVGAFGSLAGGAQIVVDQSSGESLQGLSELLSQLKQYVPLLSLDARANQQLEREIVALDEEAKQTKPDRTLIRRRLITLNGIVEGVASNVIAQGIIMGIQTLLAKL